MNKLPHDSVGLSIVVEGPDGIGKSTFVKRLDTILNEKLEDYIKKEGIPSQGGNFSTIVTAFGEGEVGSQIRRLVISTQNMDHNTQALLIAAARREALVRVMEIIQERRIAIINRWIDSTFIYQNEVSVAKHCMIHKEFVTKAIPTYTIFLTGSDEVIDRRLSERKRDDVVDIFEDSAREAIMRRRRQYLDITNVAIAEGWHNRLVFNNDGSLADMDAWITNFVNVNIIEPLIALRDVYNK